jgi:hypothetical protein
MNFDMFIQRATLIFLGIVLSLAGAIGQSFAAEPANQPAARIHWLGLKNISADTNAANVMRIWVQPETTALVAQTLDKLSRVPGHGASNAASALLRPLLEDLVYSEFYLEARYPTNSALRTLHSELGTPNSQLLTSSSQFVLAVRLPGDHARLWQTNLAAALQLLDGLSPVTNATGWTLSRPAPPLRVEYCRSGDWTLVAVNLDAPVLKSAFARPLLRRLSAADTNTFWLEIDLDLPRADDTSFPLLSHVTRHTSLSHIHLTLDGEAGNVITHATIDLSKPLPTVLPAWDIPTNLIHQPISGFTAVRGISSWLAALPTWQKLQLASPPDQAFFWTQPDLPGQMYFAAPLPNASNQLAKLTARLIQDANPWLATNAQYSFVQWETNPPGMIWKGVYILTPTLKPVTVNGEEFVLGASVPFPEDNKTSLPADILNAISRDPNLVFFEADQTDARLESELFVGQLLRLFFNKAQMGQTAAATVWLKNVEPLMNPAITRVTKAGSQQLTLTRKSTLGFTALELHLIGDWLESPQFPHGLHTFLALPEKR